MKFSGILTILIFCLSGFHSTNAQTEITPGKDSLYNKNIVHQHHAPLVCMLTSAEQAKRKEALQKEVFSKVNKIEEVEDGFEFYFDDQDNFLIKISDYILVEKQCCPFFKYVMTIEPNGGGIRLKVGGTQEVKKMLKMMVDEMNP